MTTNPTRNLLIFRAQTCTIVISIFLTNVFYTYSNKTGSIENAYGPVKIVVISTQNNIRTLINSFIIIKSRLKTCIFSFKKAKTVVNIIYLIIICLYWFNNAFVFIFKLNSYFYIRDHFNMYITYTCAIVHISDFSKYALFLLRVEKCNTYNTKYNIKMISARKAFSLILRLML